MRHEQAAGAKTPGLSRGKNFSWPDNRPPSSSLPLTFARERIFPQMQPRYCVRRQRTSRGDLRTAATWPAVSLKAPGLYYCGFSTEIVNWQGATNRTSWPRTTQRWIATSTPSFRVSSCSRPFAPATSPNLPTSARANSSAHGPLPDHRLFASWRGAHALGGQHRLGETPRTSRSGTVFRLQESKAGSVRSIAAAGHGPMNWLWFRHDISTLATGYNPRTLDLEALRCYFASLCPEFLGIAALCAAAGACSSSKPCHCTLPHFNDITTATPEIQAAARAVVRLQTAGEYGTGFFISPTGLLLTNNHVLAILYVPLRDAMSG